jgi:hypothetical protein
MQHSRQQGCGLNEIVVCQTKASFLACSMQIARAVIGCVVIGHYPLNHHPARKAWEVSPSMSSLLHVVEEQQRYGNQPPAWHRP